MDFTNMLLLQSPTAGMNVFGQALQVNADSAMGGATADGKFADLLDVVEDLNIADLQKGLQEEVSSDALQEIFKQESIPLQQAINQSQILLGQSQLTSQVAPSVVPVDTQSSPVIAKNPNEKQVGQVETGAQLLASLGLGNQILPETSQKVAAPSSESVAAWTKALSEGSLKSVVVENLEPHLNAQVLAPKSAELVAPTAASGLMMAATPVITAAPAMVAAPVVARESTVSAIAAAPAAAEPSEAPEVKVNEKPAHKILEKTQDTKQEQKLVSVSENDKSSKDTSQQKDKELDQPKTGKDLLLANDFAISPNPQTVSSPAIKDAGKLLSPSDKRISSDSVDYVADRVQNLVNQGGGQIRVVMDGQNLGTLNIKVTQRMGQIDVKIESSRPDALKLLEQARTQLSAKLESAVGPARLEMGMSQNVALTTNAGLAEGARLDSFMSLRMASSAEGAVNSLSNSSAQNLNNQVPVQGSSSSKMTDASMGDAWQRQERREAAQDLWEQSRNQRARKSA